jgi:hypothetical protein
LPIDLCRPPTHSRDARGNGLMCAEVSFWSVVREIFLVNAFGETGGEFLP